MLDTADDAPTSGDEVADRILASLTETPDAPETEPAPEAQPVTEEPAAPSADPVDEPPAEAAADDTAPTDATPAPIPPTIDPGTPFSFKADGKTVDVPGAVVRGDVVEIPRAAWDSTIQKHLADRTAIQRHLAQAEQRVKTAEAQRSDKERLASAMIEQVKALFTEQDDEKFADAMFRARQNFPLALKDAELAAYKSRIEERERQEQEALQVQHAEAAPAAIKHWVAEALQVALTQPEFADDAKDPAFKARAARVIELGINRVIVNGETNADEFYRILREEAADARERRAIQTKAAQYEAAAKANAEKKKAPPPTVPARGAPTGTSKTLQFKTKAEYEAYLESLASGAA